MFEKSYPSCGFLFSIGDTLHHTWWKKWNDKLGKLFFSHGQRNSCGVAFGFIGNTSFEVSNKKQDESGRILILDVKVSDNNFLQLIYTTLIRSLNNWIKSLYSFGRYNWLNYKNIIVGEAFNIFFKVRCGNPKMKNKSVAEFVDIKESLGLSDIWRVRNPKKKRYTFRQQVNGFIQRRLDYFLVSNNLQLLTKRTF